MIIPEKIFNVLLLSVKVKNPYALYVNCDGAMDYDKKNTGGIGFIISFPESTQHEDILISKGAYTGGNIERIEYEALIQAMHHILLLYTTQKEIFVNISQIIFVTDRFALNDQERTNPYRIKEWRHNNWKNHEGKPIKNHELLDKLDKIRKKLSEQTRARINIEYRPRKQNKIADKLAKAAKKDAITNDRLSKKGEKIGKRIYDGGEIKYKVLKKGQQIKVHIFRKDPVQELWEVWCEICQGECEGQKLKIYVDDELAAKLKRRNYFIIQIKSIFDHHILIYRTIKKFIK